MNRIEDCIGWLDISIFEIWVKGVLQDHSICYENRHGLLNDRHGMFR
jgi:hypothetical protein